MIVLLCAAAYAASWTVSVDPLTTALGFVHVQVEHTLSPRASLYLGPSLHLYSGLLDTAVVGEFRGYGVETGVRGFLRADAPRGAWVMLRGVGARVTTESPTHTAAFGGFTSGLLGYTAIIGPGLVLSGGGGMSWFSYAAGDAGLHGFLPALHTNIGWAF